MFLINQHNSIGTYIHESFEFLNDWILPYNKLELEADESDKRF